MDCLAGNNIMMQIVGILIAVFLFVVLTAVLGKTYNNCINQKEGKALLNGFFLYFALFEIIALPMIMLKLPLHVLCILWMAVLVVIAVTGCISRVWRVKFKIENKAVFLVLVLLVLLQIVVAVMKPNNSWDTAFYIGGVVKSVQTDTMYLYDGYTGWKDTVINLKYAMCSFYMHDAVLSRVMGIHAAVVCRWFNTLVCHIFSAYIVYCLGMEIWNKKKDACFMVIFWVIANLGMTTEYFAGSFLMNRSYEAKAFCANIVIPAALYYLLKIIKNPSLKSGWINLFVLNIASVAISSSSLLLIPLMEGIVLLIMIVIKRRPAYLKNSLLCVLPSIFYLALYMLNHFNIWKIPV